MKQMLFLGMLFIGLLSNGCKEKTKVGVTVDDNNTTDRSSANNDIDGTYVIDVQSSEVRWKGYKPTGVHNGTVPVSSGNVTVANGNVTGGTINIDMTGITVLDLQGDNKMKLEAHLKGKDPGKEEDFFNVGKFPNATYTINSVSKLDNDPDGTHMVNGTLTIKDISKPVNFKTKINISGGKLSTSSPEFAIDRTGYDIRFKSRKFFNNLQDDFINDEFTLQINVNATRQ